MTLAVPALAQARSYGFDIVNRTGSTLRVQDITPHASEFEVVDGTERKPAIGDSLFPDGKAIDVELRRDQSATATLAFIDQDGDKYTAVLKNQDKDGNWGSFATCTHSDKLATCEVDESRHATIRFIDPPGTERTISGSSAQRQMNILSDLCKDGSAGQCSFASNDANAVDTYLPGRVIGQPILNCGVTAARDRYSFAETVDSRNSIGTTLTGSVTLRDLVDSIKVSFKLTYDYAWGHSKTFTQTLDIPEIPPKSIAYMDLTVPIQRQYGTFQAQMNNTTWILKDVSFDAPNRHPQGLPTPSKIENRPATADELETCKGQTGVIRLRPSDVNPINGTAKANTLYSDEAGGNVRAKDGDDILVGDRGGDRLSGGKGDDNVIGGRGRDVLHGGPGSDTLQDTQGPTTVSTGGAKGGLDVVYVRDGRGDDVVHCTTRNSVVTADRGDRVTGPCGNVVRSGPVNEPPL